MNVAMLFRMSAGNDLKGKDWMHVLGSGLLAAKAFNERDAAIIPALGELDGCGVKMATTVYDTRSTGKESLRAFVNAGGTEYLESNVHFVVGPARSACSQALGATCAVVQVPAMSYWATAPSLDNRDRFPCVTILHPATLLIDDPLPER